MECNRKSARSCEQTVEDGNSLWKGQQNEGGKSGEGFGGNAGRRAGRRNCGNFAGSAGNQAVTAMSPKILAMTFLIVALGSVLAAQQRPPAHPTRDEAGAPANLIARGQYIVQDVSVCGQCHTPRLGDGRPDPKRPLDGAAVWLQSAEPVADWPLIAPRLAGNPPASDADMVKLLTTGIWTTGKHLRAPMPQFRMSKQDAEAVVAYLKSLTPDRP